MIPGKAETLRGVYPERSEGLRVTRGGFVRSCNLRKTGTTGPFSVSQWRGNMARILALIVILLAAPGVALGGGPLVVTTDGVPVGWDTASPVPYHTDQG